MKKVFETKACENVKKMGVEGYEIYEDNSKYILYTLHETWRGDIDRMFSEEFGTYEEAIKKLEFWNDNSYDREKICKEYLNIK